MSARLKKRKIEKIDKSIFIRAVPNYRRKNARWRRGRGRRTTNRQINRPRLITEMSLLGRYFALDRAVSIGSMAKQSERCTSKRSTLFITVIIAVNRSV